LPWGGGPLSARIIASLSFLESFDFLDFFGFFGLLAFFGGPLGAA
jgi:hypothetical protein